MFTHTLTIMTKILEPSSIALNQGTHTPAELGTVTKVVIPINV